MIKSQSFRLSVVLKGRGGQGVKDRDLHLLRKLCQLNILHILFAILHFGPMGVKSVTGNSSDVYIMIELVSIGLWLLCCAVLMVLWKSMYEKIPTFCLANQIKVRRSLLFNGYFSQSTPLFCY